MELRQIQYFVAVAQEMHFTRAARRMHIVQSALSASVKALEEELGCKLLIRSTRNVRLTPAGAVFYEKARAALQTLQQARSDLADVQGLRRGALTIGTVQTLPAFLDLPSLLAAFHPAHPLIEVRLRQGNRTHFLEQLKLGELDLAILPVFGPEPGVASEIVVNEKMVLVCAPGHPLSSLGQVRLDQLGDETFVEFQPGWGTRSLVDTAFGAAGIVMRIGFEVSELGTQIGLVIRGLAVALVPERVAREAPAGLKTVQLAGPPIFWQMAVAYLASSDGGADALSGPATAFLELMHNNRVDVPTGP